MEDDELVQRLREWMQHHKILAGITVLLIAAVGVFAWNLVGEQAALFSMSSAADRAGYEQEVVSDRGVSHSVPSIGEAGGGSDDFQVQTGHATIESADAAADMETFRGKVSELMGEIEEEEKQTSDETVTYHVTARIPVDRFDTFTAWLQDTYTVEDMSLRVETVSVEQQRNQVQVLREALHTYNNLLAKLNRSTSQDIDADTVEAIAAITDRKRQVAQELERLGYSIGEVEERAAMATVRVTFREEKPVDITPEDTGRRFKLAWKRSVDSFMDAAAELSALPVAVGELLLQVVKYVVYVFVVVVPAYFAYRGLRWTVEKLGRIGR